MRTGYEDRLRTPGTRVSATPRPSRGRFYYPGFADGSHTPVPDDVFDVLVPHLTVTELRILLLIVRHTLGVGAPHVTLCDITEAFQRWTGTSTAFGLSCRAVMQGCAGLVRKGVVAVDRTGPEEEPANSYRLRTRAGDAAVDASGSGRGRSPRAPRSQRWSLLLVQELLQLGFARAAARDLVKLRSAESIRAQITALPYRRSDDPRTTLDAAIRHNWPLPPEARPTAAPASARTAQIEAYLSMLCAKERGLLDALAVKRIRLIGGPFFTDRRTPECIRRHFVYQLVAERLGLSCSPETGPSLPP